MNRHNVENYKMLTKVADFAANNVGLFRKSSAGLEVQKSLETEVQELAELSSARISAESALRSGRNDRANAQDALKELFARADLTARALGSYRFRSPRKPSDHALIASGRAFAADIEPLKKEFAGYGFSPDAVAAAVKALERAVRGYAAAKSRRTAAIREFEEKLAVAMGDMRRFEAIVTNTLAGNPAAIAEWTVARSIHRVGVRKPNNKTPDTSDPAAQTKAA